MEKSVDRALIEAKAVSQYVSETLSCPSIPEEKALEHYYYPGKILEVSNFMRQEVIHHDPLFHDTSSNVNEIASRHHLTNTNMDSTVVAEYELLHRVHEFLGLLDPHQLDYAYRPVLIPLYNNGDEDDVSLSHHNNLIGTSSTWFATTHTQARFRRDYDTESKYERVGNTAFAGGSHGEVWRARRRCNQVVTYETMPIPEDMMSQSTPPSSSPPSTTSPSTVCDDTVDLIMKRLKVEHGFDILEAGMREVYFGQILVKQPLLFTHFLDHFFHKAHPGAEPELWLVFENAGVSLRSLLYTPLETEDFFLYRHSEFWRQLRMTTQSYAHNKDEEDSRQASSLTAVVHPLIVPITPTLTKPLQSSLDPTSVPFPENSALLSKELPHDIDSSKHLLHRSETRRENALHKRGNITIKTILKQILVSAAALHELGIIHRDIKPSNVMCQLGDAAIPLNVGHDKMESDNIQKVDIVCKLADFSSAWDRYATRTLYTFGPSAAEQTDEYAPPEVLFGEPYIPFDPTNPQSYDSWSIGVVALELLLGTPHVFSVDQRTTTLLTSRMERDGATMEQIRQALYLSALSQFCIYNPLQPLSERNCTLQDFHRALRARDPLGVGLDSSMDHLLELIWGLLAWDPKERLSPKEALSHRYFMVVRDDYDELIPGDHNALEPVATDPLILDPAQLQPFVQSFICPGCSRTFGNLNSCIVHTRSRRHARFCHYDTHSLPPCLNYHHLLPNHPTSGYCDIQGRRRVIEDFHSIRLKKNHQFYGIFDGHNGNLASKYASSFLYNHIITRMHDVDEWIRLLKHTGQFLKYLYNIVSFHSHRTSLSQSNMNALLVPDSSSVSLLKTLEIWIHLFPIVSDMIWKMAVQRELMDAFRSVHMDILQAIENQPEGSGGAMCKSGTTATVLFIFEEAVVLANVGDSSAVLSVGASYKNIRRKELPGSKVLTVDHIASNLDEQDNIKDKGGNIMYSGGIERVGGELAITRSLGDPHLMQYLSQTPHVVAFTKDEIKNLCHHSTTESMPCFIVLASDGLWDVMTPNEAIELVELVIHSFDAAQGISWEEGGAFQEAAKVLTHEAYVRGSTDNIGVCIVALPF